MFSFAQTAQMTPAVVLVGLVLTACIEFALTRLASSPDIICKDVECRAGGIASDRGEVFRVLGSAFASTDACRRASFTR